MHTAIARLLTPDGAETYARLRTAMLIDVPHAFGSSPGEGKGERADEVMKYLSDPDHAIAVIDHPDASGELAAAAGIMRVPNLKMRHRAGIWGVYCVPELRGLGLGLAVVLRVIEQAREWDGVETVGLSVSAHSPQALALYESLGFEQWGTEPDAMRIEGESFDEIHLALRMESHVEAAAPDGFAAQR